MLLGALIPGSGVAVEATFDISTELAIDMIIDSDLSEDLVENSVDFAQGVVEGEAFDKATGSVKAQAATGVIAISASQCKSECKSDKKNSSSWRKFGVR